jgi:hypothetical protein
MSLGNVTYSHHNEQYFHRAIRYLRRAHQMSGFRLSPYLQRYEIPFFSRARPSTDAGSSYLDDYGRLVE